MQYTHGHIAPPAGLFTPQAIGISFDTPVTLSEGSNPLAYPIIDHNVGQMTYAVPEITVPLAGVYDLKSTLLFERIGVLGTLSNVRLDIEVDNGAGYIVVASDQAPDSTLSLGEVSGLTPHRDYQLNAGAKVRAVLTYNSTLSTFLSLVFPNTGNPVNFLSVSRVA